MTVKIDGTNTVANPAFTGADTDTGLQCGTNEVKLVTGGTARATVDSSGRLLVGETLTSVGSTMVLSGRSDNATGGSRLYMSTATTSPANGSQLGGIYFSDDSENTGVVIEAVRDGGTWTSGSSHPSRISFGTAADGASSPTERMRISKHGDVFIGRTADSNTDTGTSLFGSGFARHNRNAASVMDINRGTNDGALVQFRQAGTIEGSISVSSSTVSYNGGHLSRWSQLAGGAERTEILRGSVLSNLDEMCEWGEEDNEQLNRMQVSNVEGDPNVAGVFQSWDDDDDTYTNDFYCAMTGDFVIRIAQGTTVARGDLLMSAGDGTAKPQDDDIVRSKTIAKVTSTTVSTTYSDGSYCVPCVLIAC